MVKQAVIFFGGLTLLLTLMLGVPQLAFQIIQVDLARQQLNMPVPG